MKKTNKQIAEEFKKEVETTTTADFVPGGEVTDNALLPAQPRTLVQYEPFVVPSNLLPRLGFGHSRADGVTPVMLIVNKDARFAPNRNLGIEEFPVDGKVVKLNVANAMMNLVGGMVTDAPLYARLERGANWHIEPESVSYITVFPNAVYADGMYLRANGFGDEYEANAFYVGSIKYGVYSWRKLILVPYDAKRIAELNTTAAGIKQAGDEQRDRNMAAKFLAGQYLASGLRYHVWPIFFTKDEQQKWQRDMEHLVRAMTGFEKSVNGDKTAQAVGRMLYNRKVLNGTIATTTRLVDAGAVVIDTGLKVRVQRGANVVVEPASALVGQTFTMRIAGAADRRIRADEKMVWAQVSVRQNALLIPVEPTAS